MSSSKSFGLKARGSSSSRGSASFRGGSSSNTRANWRGGRGRGSWRGRGGGKGGDGVDLKRDDEGTQLAEKFEKVRVGDEVDEKLGFGRLSEGTKKEGWLINMHPTLLKDPDWPGGRAGVDYYFIEEDGGSFKCTVQYDPYLLIACKPGTESSVEEHLRKTYGPTILSITRDLKQDLSLPNHLTSPPRLFLSISFRNVSDLLTVRRDLLPLAKANGARRSAVDAYAEVVGAASNAFDIQVDAEGGMFGQGGGDGYGGGGGAGASIASTSLDPRECIIDIREYDVTYYLRTAIDLSLRVGLWYTITFSEGCPSMVLLPERVKRPDPVVMAYDIETTKAPLKFPDRAVDQVMMVSYMVDGQGYLITNREIVGEDIEDFEYTPKEGYEGPFVVFNEPDEAALILKFFAHIRELKPTVMATFNGDFFDFPFLCERAKGHGIDMFLECGWFKEGGQMGAEDEFRSRTCVHMDCFRWVKRDSYLPQGSQGLKAVTTAKLGYNPIELDPELMTPYAQDQPQVLAQYSVSDAVATYYLYMKYVHPFIFSLCNIIPLNPDEVLRKGTGTLCETLLMVEAYEGKIVFPNRHEESHGGMYEGHLLASETYVGGHVEALEAGVFRSDIETDFRIVPEAVQGLIDQLDDALTFAIVEENNTLMSKVTNYDDVKTQIQTALEKLRDTPVLTVKPLIYHLDVAAMYPNIMLSNRLQPDSLIDESVCAVCDYNRPGKTCDRRLEWAWRGEYFPAQRDEFNMIKHALNQESFPSKWPNGPKRRFGDLSEAEQAALIQKRLGDYSRKVYKKTKDTKIETREAIVCQRENPFYVDTVRRFRDRRYEYKGLHKTWKKNLDVYQGEGRGAVEVDEAKKLIVIYDSLQLAHKCILNSFYGYVMRKGARWHSMEMAGITCLTGARIIQMARVLVEQIGRPLELDTDGIWCMLPGVFPENFKFQLEGGKTIFVQYPCTMLNHLVHARFTNDQYHELDPETGDYKVHSENSIFFELDGPYRAMILPSSKEEDKLLKKRYAVFNEDGSLAELKGFEVKRRGELQLIKIFQSAIFEKFLLGTTITECYAAVARVADQWLDVLSSRAQNLSDEELVELIAENRSMSKTLAEYAGQKSTSISTARRLAEFLGDQMVKDKGLACRFIISAKPPGAPVTERAVPIAIFSAPSATKRTYLRKWLKDPGLVNFELRSILDWGYYEERLGSVIMKLITIPAAMQGVVNPVPRVRHPEWLVRRVREKGRGESGRQGRLTDFFSKKAAVAEEDGEGNHGAEEWGESGGMDVDSMDMEDIGLNQTQIQRTGMQQPRKAVVNRRPTTQRTLVETQLVEETQAAPEPEPEIPLPDPSRNYSAWLKAMKATRWKSLQARQWASSSSGAPSFFRPGGRVGRPTPQSWDIVQFRETSVPGRFMMWVSVNGRLNCIPVRVPRTFYVQMRSNSGVGGMGRGEEGEEFFRRDMYEYEKVVRTMPRGLPCGELWKVVVKEDAYREMEGHFVDVQNSPRVEGVFEQQVPLAMRAIFSLGRTCTTGETAITLNRAENYGLDLEQLSPPSNASASHKQPTYLESLGRQIFLYHACSATAPLHVFALFVHDSPVRLHIVDPATRRQSIPNLEKLYSELEKKHRNKHGFSKSSAFPPVLQFTTAYHHNDTNALKAVSRDLGLVEERSYTVVISSSKDKTYFDTGVTKLAKFPALHMSKVRSAHTLDIFPWQSHVGTKMLTRFLSIGPWLDKLISLAVYYDVPIGHIDGDQPLLLTDIALARKLIAQDFVLWWSPSDKPDLGGIENDRRPIEDLPVTEVTAPGAYPNVCMEISVRNLAVDAVLHFVIVHELEGAGGSTAFDSVSRTLDEFKGGDDSAQLRDLTLGEAHVSPATFSLIRGLIKTWLFDKIQTSYASPACVGVDHFWRWVSSPSSNLYDPSIHRFVHGLMHKTFLQLLAEFKRLGASVVYADFTKLILATTKPPGTAHAYATYITTAVTSHELFQHIYLKTERFWDFLVLMDESNMGGIICEDPLAVNPPDVPCLGMFWNIREFLPPACQGPFFDAVRILIVELFRIREKANKTARIPLRALANGPDSSQAADTAKSVEVDSMHEFVTGRYTGRLLRSIGRLLESYKDAVASSSSAPELLAAFEFPILPGSHLPLSSPPLELIKSICAVASLVRECNLEVGVMRRNLLELVGVKEFSGEAVWKNPCQPLKLYNIPCRHCDAMRDFDFCRDPDLLPSSQSELGGRARWYCPDPRCGGEFDRYQIEFMLIAYVHSLERSFAQQDLKCTRCKQVKESEVARLCKCSGVWGVTMARAEARRRLRTCVNVGIVCGFGRLKECAQTMLDSW